MLRIDCCKDCVPPKRQLGCHDRCEVYKKQKEQYEKEMQKYKESKNPIIAKGSFLGDSGQKRKKRKF